MSPDPNNSGSDDEHDLSDDLQPTYDSHPSQSGDAAEVDATIDSVDQTPESNRNSDTADAIEKTIDSIKSQDSPVRQKPPVPPRNSIEETYPSQSPASSDSDDFSNLTEMSQDIPGTDSDSIQERETARQIEATYDSIPDVIEIKGDDREDEFELSHTKLNQLPTHIGRYEIKRLLGEGTFGKVYEARDPQLDRIVAVKVAKSISGRTQVKRFLREARAAAKLRHPSIIPVYEYGQVNGENIIVYEFVEGENLKAYLRRKKRLPLEETVEIVRQIAEGLNYAHEEGIIHRDIKPENILITSAGRPHIADFGCARSMEDNTNLTIDGSILGTPMYMSPEQAGGKSNIADGRTDIWSLGVMLYEMTSGKRPFDGQLADLLFRICNKDASPLRKIRPEIPLDIETICNKCLTRDLDKRFASAEILADELARFQRGEPIKSRRIGPIQRTWMWAKRNRAIASLMAAVALTMLIGTIGASAFAFKAYREKLAHTHTQKERLVNSDAVALPGIFEDLEKLREAILPQLKDQLIALQTGSEEDGLLPLERRRHRLKMAILKLEPYPAEQWAEDKELVKDLLAADSSDFFVFRKCLEFRKSKLTSELWEAAKDSDSSRSEKRFRAAAALAQYDPKSPNWATIAPDVASYLTSFNEVEWSQWRSAMDPVRDFLLPTLRATYLERNDDRGTPKRAAAILSYLFRDDVEFLVGRVPDAIPEQIPYLTASLKNHDDAVNLLSDREKALRSEDSSTPIVGGTPVAVQLSNLVIAKIQLGDQNQWGQFASKTDMSVSTELIERIGPAETPFETLDAKIRELETVYEGVAGEADILSGILLSLGQFKQYQILGAQQGELKTVLLNIFNNHPDSRVHCSARWLLQKWEFDKDLALNELALRRALPDPKMNWHVDMAGITFVLFGPFNNFEFEMGLNEEMASELGENDLLEPLHRKSIPRRFGICIHEVTNQQFLEFQEDFIGKKTAELQEGFETLKKSAGSEFDEETALKRLDRRVKNVERPLKKLRELDGQLPVVDVNFYSAAAFCRWLSDQQELESGLHSVEDLHVNEKPIGFAMTQAILDCSEYRLPTTTEWEYACRGPSTSLFPFGRMTTHAKYYAWFANNSGNVPHRVGQLKPGNTGLFDVLGNVDEWCLDVYYPKLPDSANSNYEDHGPEFDRPRPALNDLTREFRGGSYADRIDHVRPTKRFNAKPNMVFDMIGFRLTRTYEWPPKAAAPNTKPQKNLNDRLQRQ